MPNAVRPADRGAQKIDLAGIQARTREYEERLARHGTLATVAAGQDFGRMVEEGRRRLARPDGAELKAAGERIGDARELLRRQVAAMRSHLAAVERSMDNSPHAAVLKPRIERQRVELERRQELVFETLDSVRNGIEDRGGGVWGQIASAVRRLVGRDPESRLDDVQRLLRQWGASEPPPTLGAVTGNEGLTYVTWGGAATAMPQGSVAAAYTTGGSAPEALEDTSAGQETEPSDDLLAKAAELKTAVAIANFVRNDLRLEWYRGSLKGAVETFREGGGNDADLASVTIALLRANGIPARYVYGTIELPVGKAADLMGLMDGSSLAAFYAAPASWTPPTATRELVVKVLTAAGVTFEPVVSGGLLAALRIPHYWVEAFVPYSDYRGGGKGRGVREWVALEPSIPGGAKYEAIPAKVDVLGLISGGAAGLTEEYLSGTGAESPLEVFRRRAGEALRSGGFADADGRRSLTQRREVLNALPGSLPYKVTAVHAEYALLPEDMKHHARIRVEDGVGTSLDVTLALHKLVGQRSVLIYVPASDADADLITSSGGYWDAPASAVEVRATIRIKGATVAEASRSAGLGATQRWSVEITDLGGTRRRIENPVIAGNLVAIAVGAPRNGYQEGPLYLESDDDGPAPRYLFNLGASYANAWSDAEEEVATWLSSLRLHPTANVTFIQYQLHVHEALGIRERVEWKGLAVDADLRPMVSIDVATERTRDLFQVSGFQGSWLEQRVLEQELNGVRAISTVSLLQVARQQGVPVLVIDQANQTQMLAQANLEPALLSEIVDHIARGRMVRVPSRAMTVEDWTGNGYISMNPLTGESGYFLNGALSGAMTVLSPLKWDGEMRAKFGANNGPHQRDVIDWAIATPLNSPCVWKQISGRQEVSHLVKNGTTGTPAETCQVGDAKTVSVAVTVWAQWKCCTQQSNGICTKTESFAAPIKNAPVLFERFNGAQFAMSERPDALSGLLSASSPVEVVAAIHGAANRIEDPDPTAVVCPRAPSGGTGTASGHKVVCSDAIGQAKIYVTPDPVIGSGVSGVLIPPEGKEKEPTLIGVNDIMASVSGTRPHDSSSYELRLLEPITIKGTPAEVDSVRADTATDLFGAVGGLEYGTELRARVIDRFGNTLANKVVTWTDGGASGRFLGSKDGALFDYSFLAGLGPQVLNLLDSLQEESPRQTTNALFPVQVSYIPPYDFAEGLKVTAAATGNIQADFTFHAGNTPNVYLDVVYNRTRFHDGVKGTYFSAPLIAGIFAREGGGQWSPITSRSPGYSKVSITAATTVDGVVVPTETQTTADVLAFDLDGLVRIRPKFVAENGVQDTVVLADVLDASGTWRGTDQVWHVQAQSRRVAMSVARLDSALTRVGLPLVDPAAKDRNLARTTDSHLIARVDNPSEEPVYLRVLQTPAPILTFGSLGQAVGMYGVPGLIQLPPGISELSIPVRRQDCSSGKCVEVGITPDVRYRLPSPGHVFLELWAPFVRRESGEFPEVLDQEVSVHHALPTYGGGPDAAKGAADVQYVGGFKCTYAIYDHVLTCEDPAFLGDTSVRGFKTDARETYSGHFSPGALAPGSCLDNPCAQCWVHDTNHWEGPIPEGEYNIGQGYLDYDRTLMSYKLEKLGTVCDGTFAPVGTPNPPPKVVSLSNAFMIHFGKLAGGTTPGGGWSEGCVVVKDDTTRDRLNELGGGTLTVTFGSGSRDLCPVNSGVRKYGYRPESESDATPADPCSGLWPPGLQHQ